MPYKQYWFIKFISIIVIITFVTTMLPVPLVYAQPDLTPSLPAPGVRVSLSPQFNPPILKGIKVYHDNPLRFDFVLDRGDLVGDVRERPLRDESTKLIKYFLASLTIPEKDLWVNLSPYEKNRIVPESFGQTEMGRDLLAEDYMLKQITASLIYPEDETGKRFWGRVYEEAAKKFGTTNIPVNTFNKVWIVPKKAVVYENAEAGTAYVVESKLKVMLEEDYVALNKTNNSATPPKISIDHQQNLHPGKFQGVIVAKNTNTLASQIVREIVLPQLEKEINEGRNFAQLRQVYNSLILATWYKKKIKDSILAKVYADKNKIAGVEYKDSIINQLPTRPSRFASQSEAAGASPLPNKLELNVKAPQGSSETTNQPSNIIGQQPNDVESIYQQYLKAFKKGVYNYIKEEQDPVTQQMVPRKYFSGGLALSWENWAKLCAKPEDTIFFPRSPVTV